jgi:hypothetical protein
MIRSFNKCMCLKERIIVREYPTVYICMYGLCLRDEDEDAGKE